MRTANFSLAVVLLLSVPGLACGEQDRVAPLDTLTVPIAGLSTTVHAAAAQGQFPSPSQHRCCNRNGAMIGALAGAALGSLLTLYTCDAAHCTAGYIKYMAVGGGLGAAIGAFADARQT